MTKKNGSLILGCIALGVLAFIGTTMLIGHQNTDETNNAPRLPDTMPAQFMPAWTYQNDIDDMRGTTIHNAYIESNDEYTNSIGDNPTRTKLFIRLKGKGLDVFVSNENLQYTCASYVDSYVSLKFDDGPVVKYQCTNSSGNKYGLAFIANEKQVVEKIKKSKRLIIETPVYQRGDIQQTFVIEGFNWEQLNR